MKQPLIFKGKDVLPFDQVNWATLELAIKKQSERKIDYSETILYIQKGGCIFKKLYLSAHLIFS